MSPAIYASSETTKISEWNIPLSNSLTLRIYSDTRPHNGKITDIQKGLILIHEGTETVGEGTGFGFPVLIYSDETYFSGTSQVNLVKQKNRTIICKEFFMDRIARNRFRNVKLENRELRAVLRYVAGLYQRHKGLRSLSLKEVYTRIGVKSSFIKVPSTGKIIITYIISQGMVRVKADFSQIPKHNLQRLFMLNEQGAGVFRRYMDSNGTTLIDRQIGAWDQVEAERVSMTDSTDVFGFSLKRINNSILRRGREFLEGLLDWAGLDYEIDPKNSTFEYDIGILGAQTQK
jgi:hypothetical protein